VLVGIVVPGISPARVTAGLMDEDDTTRGLAEELVDVALGRRAPHVLGVVAPGLHPSERDQTKDHPTSRDGTGGDAAELVRSIAVDPDDQWGDPWLRACALRVLPSVAPDAIPSVVSRVRARPPRRPTTGLELVLDETVDWLAQLEASRARRTSASASADAELP
jgi:hypothetical protein